MLRNKLELLPQECYGNYLFSDVKPVATQAFMATFGDEAIPIMLLAQSMVLDTYENPDYLQTFRYGETKFWCMSDFKKGYKPSDYCDTDFFYITFLLPSDY